jgi:hypothetical protein
MKTLPLCIALVCAAIELACADITIVQQVEQSGPAAMNSEMTLKLKGDKVRIDVNPQLSTIYDVKSGDISTLVHPQKTVVTLPGEQVKRIREGALAAVAGKPTDFELKPTGKKETINGFACEEYTTSFQGMDSTFWLTKDVPNKDRVLEQLSGLSGELDPLQGALKNTRKFPGFPVRTVLNDGRGGRTSVTLVSLKEAPIAASEFEVPSDYKAFAMPRMQLPGAGGR